MNNQILADVVDKILSEFAHIQLKETELAISLVDLTDDQEHGMDTGGLTRAHTILHYRGEEPIYPASIVKLFYLAAVQQWLEDKKISETDELIRACKDMIVDSSNDATHYVVDILTDTTSGPELSSEEMAAWMHKRN